MSGEIDAATQAWIDEKPPDPEGPGPVDDETIAGAAAAIEAARARGPQRSSPLSGLFGDPPDEDEPGLEVGGGEQTAAARVAPPAESAPVAAPPAPPEPPRPAPEPVAAAAPEIATGADTVLEAALAPQMALSTGDAIVKHEAPGLADKFIAPPFSVLDTKAGYWQERRRAWLSLGIRGESFGAEGRKAGMIYQHDAPGSDPGFYTRKTAVEREIGRTLSTEEFRRDYYDRDAALAEASGSVKSGTSVFDPVLCEVAYRWFSGPQAVILDPFAGGAVRGIVAGILGRRYFGVELREEQIHDNRAQAGALLGEESEISFGRKPEMPRWIEGDATQIRSYEIPPADLVFTCPPYADLEVYSDDPRDLSTAPYATFRAMLSSAMAQSAEGLRDDRFAVWVVGEARGSDGLAYGFVSDTIRAARDCGLGLYNEAILLNSVGSAALRAQRILRSRKLTRIHQHVLVFVKGDPKRAAQACGSAELEK